MLPNFPPLFLGTVNWTVGGLEAELSLYREVTLK